MKKYRFRTREEFELIGRWIDDDGCPECWANDGDMNHYLGQEILASHCIALCESNDNFNMDGWVFSNHDYVVMEEEDNIALAKKMYPIGTKFYPAHISVKHGRYCIVTNDKFSNSNNDIIALTDEGHPYNSSLKYGGNDYNRIVYHKGKWAEIVKEEESLAGRWIKFLKQISANQPIGSYDLIKKDEKGNSCIQLQEYGSCTRSRFKDGEIELMPEGWIPLTEKTIPELIPTHVKCVQRLNDAKIGKIYRVVNRSQCECENDVLYLWDSIEFQPSSKDAYDAQFKQEGSSRFKIGDWIIWDGSYKGQAIKIASIEDGGHIDTGGNWRDTKSPHYRLAHSHEIPKEEIDMKLIQEECKRRFPIGCTFKGVNNTYECVLRDGCATYSIHKDSQIYAHSGAGCLYDNGVYAELVSLPETQTYYPLYATVGDPLPTSTTKPLIENVQSINITLRTKKQINKLKF